MTLEQAARLVGALARGSLIVADPAESEPLSRDPQDDFLIGLARAASAHVLVTGDDDLLIDPVDLKIVSPREFLELLPS